MTVFGERSRHVNSMDGDTEFSKRQSQAGVTELAQRLSGRGGGNRAGGGWLGRGVSEFLERWEDMHLGWNGEDTRFGPNLPVCIPEI